MNKTSILAAGLLAILSSSEDIASTVDMEHYLEDGAHATSTISAPRFHPFKSPAEVSVLYFQMEMIDGAPGFMRAPVVYEHNTFKVVSKDEKPADAHLSEAIESPPRKYSEEELDSE